MEEKKMELMEMQAGEVGNLEMQFMSTGSTFCSFQDDSEEGKIKLFTAMNNPTYRVEEKLNCTIAVKDIYAEAVQLVDEKTGTITDTIRIVLIDENGDSYGCCSMGMFSALKKLMRVFGTPTWEKPIKVQPYQTPTRNGKNKIFTLRVVNE